VRVEARAKLNLGLIVGRARPDGFHDLTTIFQSVSLADTLEARPRRSGFRLSVRFEDVAWPRPGTARARPLHVPVGPDNLVLRAARLVADRLGLPGGATFRLVKRIPARAGLGGGSADAAAAMAALLRLHRRRVPLATRLAWAAELGSDVPFAVLGGTALGRGRGERLTRLRLAAPFRAVIAMPGWHVSTRDAFIKMDQLKNFLTLPRRTLRSGQSVAREEVRALDALRVGNTFERVLGGHARAFASLVRRLRVCGLVEPRLTGSGSAVFALLPRGMSQTRVAAAFQGSERLFFVRSMRTSARITTIAT
jgi:4-diphosphocytidyl-2-C-methyl-D-erythritol kinase